MVGPEWNDADFLRHFRKSPGPERTREPPSGLLAVPLRSPERVPKSGLLRARKRLAHRCSKNVANDKSTSRALRIDGVPLILSAGHHAPSFGSGNSTR